MSLDAIPAGVRVLIDANILIYAKRAMSAQCRRLLERCAQQEITGVLTTIVLAEFCHRRMMQEAQSRGLSGSNPAKALAQNPGLVRQLTSFSLKNRAQALLLTLSNSASFSAAAACFGDTRRRMPFGDQRSPFW